MNFKFNLFITLIHFLVKLHKIFTSFTFTHGKYQILDKKKFCKNLPKIGAIFTILRYLTYTVNCANNSISSATKSIFLI